MFTACQDSYREELDQIRTSGLYKDERIILSDQKADIRVTFPVGSPSREVINFCANNYLGLANHPALVDAAHKALDAYGFGMSSVRFICGTQDQHKKLEETIAGFYETEDTILYSSCFDANGGLFEVLLGEGDAIVTDALNHASIIDGIRLCKAKRHIYQHTMEDLKVKLEEARQGGARRILIATDGVFSMDGDIADLKTIVELAEEYQAMVMVDDSHATGFLGAKGRGSVEYCGVLGKIDVITSTLGKAMGGASGGFTTGRREIIELLRQRSRPYLFSNSLAPSIVGASLEAFRLIREGDALREKLMANTRMFREGIRALGFHVNPGVHPIAPVLFGSYENDAVLATEMARRLYDEGIYVIAFSFPVVPRGKARIRLQISAAHETEHIQKVLDAFARVGREMKLIS